MYVYTGFLRFLKEHVLGDIKMKWWDFPGGPVDKTLASTAEGMGSIPGQRTKIPHATQPKKKRGRYLIKLI